jgi:branched-chain amino acid transport system substrate-binding protein
MTPACPTKPGGERSSATIAVGVAMDTGPHRGELLAAISYAIGARAERSQAFRLVPADGGRDPATAQAAATRFLDDGVAFVIGHFSASAALAAAPIYEQARIPFFAPGTSHPDLTARDYRFVFRVCGRDDDQAAMLGAVVKRMAGKSGTPPLIVSQSTPYGRSMGALLQQGLSVDGLAPRRREGVLDDAGPADFEREAIVVLAGSHDFIAGNARALLTRGHRGPLVASDDGFCQRLLDLGGDAVEGLRVAVLEAANGSSCNELARRFEQQHGYRPGAYFMTSNIAASVLVEAASRCASLGREEVAAAIRQCEWETPFGLFSFDENGDMRGLRWSARRVANGRFVPDRASSPRKVAGAIL